MRIAFFCGSLEKGKDGVGDYTYSLADVLVRLGCKISLVALYDPYIASCFEENSPDGKPGISILRLPKSDSWEQRTNKANAWINQQNPDLLSLQYVPFAFQERGLPFGFDSGLLKIANGRPWEIMFHELWLGMPKEASLKHIVWGKVQQYLIVQMLNKLKPKVIHTQCQIYMAQLQKLRFSPHFLPLFSNIPYSHTPAIRLPGSTAPLRFVVFGSIHPFNNTGEFVKELAAYKIKTGIQVQILLIGRNGALQKNFIDTCEAVGIATTILGELSPDNISQQLALADYGLATGAPLTIEKNGTVAAMWEHGLPVICIGHQWTAKGIAPVKVPEQLIIYRYGELTNTLDTRLAKQVYANHVSDVAKLFLSDIKS